MKAPVKPLACPICGKLPDFTLAPHNDREVEIFHSCLIGVVRHRSQVFGKLWKNQREAAFEWNKIVLKVIDGIRKNMK